MDRDYTPEPRPIDPPLGREIEQERPVRQPRPDREGNAIRSRIGSATRSLMSGDFAPLQSRTLAS